MGLSVREKWLEWLSKKFEIPENQIMLAWSTYQISCNLCGVMCCKTEFSEVVLPQLFEI